MTKSPIIRNNLIAARALTAKSLKEVAAASGVTSVDEKAAMIRNARGTSGSAIEYLRRNFEGLQAAGLRDPAVIEL